MMKLELNIQLFAHKKGQGSSTNGRDSVGRRLGAKASDGQYITAGSIIYRQRGTKVHPGLNVKEDQMILYLQQYQELLNLKRKLIKQLLVFM